MSTENFEELFNSVKNYQPSGIPSPRDLEDIENTCGNPKPKCKNLTKLRTVCRNKKCSWYVDPERVKKGDYKYYKPVY